MKQTLEWPLSSSLNQPSISIIGCTGDWWLELVWEKGALCLSTAIYHFIKFYAISPAYFYVNRWFCPQQDRELECLLAFPYTRNNIDIHLWFVSNRFLFFATLPSISQRNYYWSYIVKGHLQENDTILYLAAWKMCGFKPAIHNRYNYEKSYFPTPFLIFTAIENYGQNGHCPCFSNGSIMTKSALWVKDIDFYVYWSATATCYWS